MPLGQLEDTNEQPMMRPKSKLKQSDLEDYLSEMRHEPEWREKADKCIAYYDGEQRDTRTLKLLQERGLPILVRNEIAPAIDILLGMEAKNKTRSKIVSDSKDSEAEEVARALTSEVIKVERITRTGRACSDAYAEQLKAGLSWVEVAEEDNKFLGPDRVQNINRNEIYWDWRSKRHDLMDCRYLIRRRFVDKDIAIGFFPKQKDLIEHSMNDWANWDAWENSVHHGYLAECYDLENSRTSMPRDEWVSTDRKRICLYETWYRVFENILVFIDQRGIVREFDKKNLAHQTIVSSGMAELSKSLTSKVRIAWWIGPHLVSDEPSPYNHNFYPYVPFWGFRDDKHKMPYSLVSRMLSPQDEINARSSKLMDILSSKRTTMDSDALDLKYNNIAKVRTQVASANSFVVLNPNRKNIDGFKVETDITLSDRQFELMQSASAAIKEISNINTAMQGQSSGNNQSGIAVNSLIEQGNIGAAELSDNFRYGRTLVSELILASVKKRIGKKPTTIQIGGDNDLKEQEEDQQIHLNQPTTDENGMNYISNSVFHSRTEVEIEEIPSHQSVKQQQFMDMLEFIKNLPPEVAMAVAPYLALTSDLEYKKEIFEILKNMAGQGDPADQTSEQQQQQAMEKAMEELALRKEEALVSKEEANAKKLQTESVTNKVEATYSAVQSAGALAQVPELIPTADSILKSAGFEDENEYPVAQVEQPVNMTDGNIPPETALPVDAIQGNTNTSPMFPDRPSSPVEGMDTGIETQTIKDN